MRRKNPEMDIEISSPHFYAYTGADGNLQNKNMYWSKTSFYTLERFFRIFFLALARILRHNTHLFLI